MSTNLRRLSLLGVCGPLFLMVNSCAREGSADQPIVFSHRSHVEKRVSCTFCHTGAEKYSQATIPSVALCMTCHAAVKADSPEILKVKAFLERKEEIPWRRIYTLPGEADVFFNHHRHAAAGVKCAICHGEVAQRDALYREVDLTMGFCVGCHKETRDKFRDPRLAADCVTCHR